MEALLGLEAQAVQAVVVEEVVARAARSHLSMVKAAEVAVVLEHLLARVELGRHQLVLALPALLRQVELALPAQASLVVMVDQEVIWRHLARPEKVVLQVELVDQLAQMARPEA